MKALQIKVAFLSRPQDATIKLYLSSGAPPNKLVLGLGLYGRTFLLKDPSNPGINAPAHPTAFAGRYTREDGFLGYNEVGEMPLRVYMSSLLTYVLHSVSVNPVMTWQ